MKKYLHQINIYILSVILFITPLLFHPYLNLAFELPKVIFLRIAISICAIIFLIRLKKSNQISLPSLKQNKFFYCLFFSYILLTIISTLFSLAPSLSFFGSYYRQLGLLTYIHLFILFFLIISNPLLTGQKNVLFYSILSSGFLVSIYGIFQKFGSDILSGWNSESFLGRIFATMGHPNFLGQFLIMTIIVNLILIFTEKRKIILSLFFLPQISTLIFTLGRSSILGLLGGLFVMFLLYSYFYKPKLLKYSFIFVIIGVFIISIVNLIPKNQFIQKSPLKRIVLSGENLRSIKSRFYIWPTAIKIIKEYPVFGAGLETFSITFPKYQPKELLELEVYTETADRAHNEILDNLLNIGILGTLIYYSLILFLPVKSIIYLKNNKNTKESYVIIGLIGIIISQIIANQFGFPTVTHLLYFWTASALLFVLINKEEEYKIKYLTLPYIKNSLIIVSLFFILINIYKYNFTNISADASFKRAQAFAHFNNNDQSYREYEKSIKKFPYQNIYYLYGSFEALSFSKYLPSITEREKYLKAAEEMAKKAVIFTNSHDFNPFMLLGEIYISYSFLDGLSPEEQNQNIQKSLQSYQKGLELAPLNPRLLRSYAYSLYQLGNYQNSIKIYQNLLQISPPYWEWDLTSKSQEEKDKARIFYKINPDFNENFLYMARSYARLKDYQNALKYLNFAPYNIDTLSTYATIYALLGDKEEAMEYLKKALEIDSNNQLILDNLKILELQ